MVERKETFGEKYVKAISPRAVQRLTSTQNQEPEPTPLQQQKVKTVLDKTVEKFRIFDVDGLVYVDVNAMESSVKVDEMSWKSKTKKKKSVWGFDSSAADWLSRERRHPR